MSQKQVSVFQPEKERENEEKWDACAATALMNSKSI